MLGTGVWPIQAAVDLGIGILKAILVFHRAGWLHRAVRPNHVIQDAAGRILLVGLGNARHMEDTGPDHYKLPVSSKDRMYLAPEQIGRLAMESSWRTDIHAAGAVLYTASAVIAAERDGTALLKSLLDVTMTTSGARFGAVWIPRGDGWEKAASSSYGAGTQRAVIVDEGMAAVPAEQLRNCCEVQRPLVGGFGNGTGS